MHYILVVFMAMPNAGYGNGTSIQFQEFNSFKQCQYVASLIKQQETNRGAYCVEK